VTLFVDRDHRCLRPGQRSGSPGCTDRRTYTQGVRTKCRVRTPAWKKSCLLLDLLVGHPLSTFLGLHLMFLLQAPFVYVYVRSNGLGGNLAEPIPPI
jgi:hypothetical protein